MDESRLGRLTSRVQSPQRRHGTPSMRNAIALLFLAVAFGCSEPSEPGPGSGPATTCGVTAASPTPLKLQGGTRASLDGKPHGVGVSPGGVAYVTQLDRHTLVPANFPGFTFGTGIPVGNTPLRMAFNSSGTRAFVTTFSPNVQVLDVASGSVVSTIPVLGYAFAVLVAPGDSILWVTTSADTVYGIQISNGAIHHRLGIGAQAGSGADQPAGLAICDSLLYVASGQVLDEFDTRRNYLRKSLLIGGIARNILIAADKRTLYIANDDGRLVVVDLPTNTGLNVPIAGGGYGLAQSPADGRLYVTTGGGRVLVIDPATYATVDSFVVEGSVRDVAFNAEGTIAIVANEFGYVDFLTAPTIPTPPAPPHVIIGNGVHGAAISSSGVVYVTVYTGRRVAAAVLPSFAFGSGVSVNIGPLDVAFNSTGTRAYVASSPVSVIDVAAGHTITSFAMGASAVAVGPGDSIVWVSSDSIYGIQANTGAIRHSAPSSFRANFLVATDSLLYASTPDAGKVLQVDTRGDSVERTFVMGGRPQGMVLAPTGDILYVANENHQLQFWDVVNNADLGSVPLAGAGFGIARHPVTGRLYVGDFNGQVEVFDPVTRAKVDSFTVGGAPRHIAFNATGSILVVANESGWVDFLQP